MYNLSKFQSEVFRGVHDYVIEHDITDEELAYLIIDGVCEVFEEKFIDGFNYCERLGFSYFKYCTDIVGNIDSDILKYFINDKTGQIDWERFGEHIDESLSLECQFWIKGKSYFFIVWK